MMFRSNKGLAVTLGRMAGVLAVRALPDVEELASGEWYNFDRWYAHIAQSVEAFVPDDELNEHTRETIAHGVRLGVSEEMRRIGRWMNDRELFPPPVVRGK